MIILQLVEYLAQSEVYHSYIKLFVEGCFFLVYDGKNDQY